MIFKTPSYQILSVCKHQFVLGFGLVFFFVKWKNGFPLHLVISLG